MSEADLEEQLSRPSKADVAAQAGIAGDLLILGASGKMGPGLARLARRASDEAGVKRRVIGAARFSDAAPRRLLDEAAVETIACDALDPDALGRLPDCPNVIYMVGHKFGTTVDAARTWATNVLAAAFAAERFKSSRIVAFSTGNVYPLTDAAGGGPRESDPVGPVGEYAESALGRERVLEYLSRTHGTKMAILRLNYAIEPRYGVLRDIADAVLAERPIDLTMGFVNVIWQRDANSVALRALAHCASPPLVLNVTGPGTLGVRTLAQRFGERMGVQPRLLNREASTALLSNASRCVELFGAPAMKIDRMIEQVADWAMTGGRGLNKPTHFGEREGRF